METKPPAKANATDERAANLTCWRTATSPQCLRVETTNEVHLFPYGYFQHAKLARQGNKDVIEIQFQDETVIAKGKNLESLCDALARLAVERINSHPEKYAKIAKNEGMIETIEIVAATKRTSLDSSQT